MKVQLELKQTITNYLNHNMVDRLFSQMGTDPDTHLTSSEFFAYLQVITWVVQKRLLDTTHFSITQISERAITPIVNEIVEKMCVVLPEDVGFSDLMPSFLLSRIIWYTSRSLG